MRYEKLHTIVIILSISLLGCSYRRDVAQNIQKSEPKHTQATNETIMLLFKPAEETSHGARNIIETRALEDVDMIFGLHNVPTLKVGELGTKHGELTAGVDRFEVYVTGTGAHAAKPPIIIPPTLRISIQSVFFYFINKVCDNILISFVTNINN